MNSKFEPLLRSPGVLLHPQALGPPASLRHVGDWWWLAVATLGALGGAWLLVLVAGDESIGGLSPEAVLGVVVAWSFIGSGLIASRGGPETRLGRLMAYTGFAILVGALLRFASWSLLFTIGVWVASVWVILFALFLLSFPHGWVESRLDRLLLVPIVVALGPLMRLWLPSQCSQTCCAPAWSAPRAASASSSSARTRRTCARPSPARSTTRRSGSPTGYRSSRRTRIASELRPGPGPNHDGGQPRREPGGSAAPRRFAPNGAGAPRRRRPRGGDLRSRLESEPRARVEELRRSRARIVEVAQSERRRLERDLHDGAQQRLVTLSLPV